MPCSNVVRADAQSGVGVVSYAMRRVDEPVDLIEERIFIPHDNQGNRLSAIEASAYQKGFKAGEVAGSAKGFSEVESMLLPLLVEVKNLKEALLQSAEEEMLKIVLAAASHVVRHELSQNNDLALSYIRAAIQKIGPAQSIIIRVPEADLVRLSRERAQLVQLAEGVQWLNLEGDPYLQPGECIVESAERIVDARLDSQMAAVEKGLRSA